jgi:hypothetical protein
LDASVWNIDMLEDGQLGLACALAGDVGGVLRVTMLNSTSFYFEAA